MTGSLVFVMETFLPQIQKNMIVYLFSSSKTKKKVRNQTQKYDRKYGMAMNRCSLVFKLSDCITEIP